LRISIFSQWDFFSLYRFAPNRWSFYYQNNSVVRLGLAARLALALPPFLKLILSLHSKPLERFPSKIVFSVLATLSHVKPLGRCGTCNFASWYRVIASARKRIAAQKPPQAQD
jgi:hypothetical protein